MNLIQQVAEIEGSQPKKFSTLAAVVVAAAVGFVLFANSATSARQPNPLRGSGEVLRGPMTAPSAGLSIGDPSVPSAAEVLKAPRFDRVVAVDAPSF